MEEFKFESLRDRYLKRLASTISVSVEDLTDTELTLIKESFYLFESKLSEIKILEDDVKRLSVELINLKSMRDDTTNDYDN